MNTSYKSLMFASLLVVAGLVGCGKPAVASDAVPAAKKAAAEKVEAFIDSVSFEAAQPVVAETREYSPLTSYFNGVRILVKVVDGSRDGIVTVIVRQGGKVWGTSGYMHVGDERDFVVATPGMATDVVYYASSMFSEDLSDDETAKLREFCEATLGL